MPKSTLFVVKRSVIALSVVSLSACSSLPQVPDVSLGGVGNGIVNASKATATAAKKTWSTTAYLLGFTDFKDGGNPDNNVPTDEQLLAVDSDVNQVLPLDDAPMIEGVAISRPAVVLEATANRSELAQGGEPMLADTLVTGQSEDDLVHEVLTNETLWDIAKLTTGDANNWHVLADVNNLGQSASVFPGQQLIIPANIVKPSYDQPIDSTASADTQEPISALQNADASSELAANDTESAGTQAVQMVSAKQGATAFDLNTGETLWDFAKRTTGDATNWQAIAAQNNFSDKQAVTVHPGQIIFVPQQLVKPAMGSAVTQTHDEALPVDTAAATQAINGRATDTAIATASAASMVAGDASDTVIETAAAEGAVAGDEGDTVIAAAAALPELADNVITAPVEQTADALADGVSTLDETQPMTIVEATYITDDSMDPVMAEDETAQISENVSIPAQIMVSGTYYPKAVYNDADFSSSLLMRVSPGTTLQVSRAMGTWFEVETVKGVGYVHQRDIK